jgi:hypothetical protein
MIGFVELLKREPVVSDRTKIYTIETEITRSTAAALLRNPRQYTFFGEFSRM